MNTEYTTKYYNIPFVAADGSIGMTTHNVAPLPCTSINKMECKKEITPMSYDTDCVWGSRKAKTNVAAATAVNVNTQAPSDISVQREYFLNRLIEVNCQKTSELTRLYALYVNNSPKNAKDLVAAIEGKKYKFDEKKLKRMEEDGDLESCFYGPFYAIIWDGPQPDRKGYDLACIELAAQYSAAKDAIMAGDAADMKKAIANIVEWLPKQKKH